MRFVDEQVVDAGGLEGDAGVLGGVQFLLDAFLGAQQGALQALDAHPVAFPGCADEVLHPVHFGAEVLALGVGAHGDPLERRSGHDDRVPVAGRAAGDELAPSAGLEVFALGDQDFRLGVELEELAAELLQHVVGDHDAGLVDHLEAAQFHRAHGHLGGFAGADLVEQPDGGLVDDSGDGGDLVRAGLEAQGQAGQRQRRVVVGAQDDVVEQPVVDGSQLLGAGGVFPGPVAEPLGQLGGFFLGCEGVVEVEDPGLVRLLVADFDAALLQDRLGQGRGGVAAGAPGGGGQHRVPVAADGPYLPAGMLDPHAGVGEDLGEEVPDVGRVDPGGAQPGVDFAGHQVGRDDLTQFLGVDAVAGVVGGGPLGGLEFVADLAGQVLRGRDQPAAPGIIEGEGAQLAAGLVLAGSQQPGDGVQPDLPQDVQADRQRVGAVVSAQAGVAGGDDAAGEDRGLGGGLADRVEFLQRLHEGCEWVGAEAALRWADAGQFLPARVRVGAAGGPPGETVDRAVGPRVVVIAPVEVAAQGVQLGGVLPGCRLGVQQAGDRVAEPEQVPQLPGLGAGDRERDGVPLDDLGEGAVAVCFQVAVRVAGPRPGLRRAGLVRCGGPGQAAGLGGLGDAGQGTGQGRGGVP